MNPKDFDSSCLCLACRDFRFGKTRKTPKTETPVVYSNAVAKAREAIQVQYLQECAKADIEYTLAMKNAKEKMTARLEALEDLQSFFK